MDCSEFYEISYSLEKDGIILSKTGKNFLIDNDNQRIYNFFIDLDEGINFKIFLLTGKEKYEEIFHYKINANVLEIRTEINEDCMIRKIFIKTDIINYIIEINKYNYVVSINKYKNSKNLTKIYNFSEIEMKERL